MQVPPAILGRLQEGPATAAELRGIWPVSQPTLSRALQSLQRQGRVVKLGSTRAAQYGAPREIANAGSHWPLFRIDAMGAMHELGTLQSLAPRHYYCDAKSRVIGGLTDALPYFLQDQRPAGFLGRAVPQTCQDPGLPSRVMDWSDDHYLRWLTRRGTDCVSDLILGAEAFECYLQLRRSREAIPLRDREARYPREAANAMAGGPSGSSAHGEHPKFTALLDDAGRLTHVIVKFSPPVDSPIGQRWSDLLVAEHLAHEHLREHGITAAQSRVLQAGGRMFLEVERFDRVGAEGRVGVVSLLAVDAARFGQLDTWSRAAQRLAQQGALSRTDLQQIRLLEAFAMLIANTDRHFGNLALLDEYDGKLKLAPVYDMLPMLFAPEHEQLVEREFVPPDPTAETLSAWSEARRLAAGYWQLLACDSRISVGARAMSARVQARLRTA